MVLAVSENKYQALKRLSNTENVIAALAIDQRGSLKKMLTTKSGKPASTEDVINFKKAISEELTPYASSILLDPEYGLPASELRDSDAGLLMAYEKTGYDVTEPGRFPDLLSQWSVKRLKEVGADAVKFMLYYDVDESQTINEHKQAFVERVGAEAAANDLPFFLELVSYDGNMDSVKSAEFAKVKPHKVIDMVKEFSKPEYGVTVLKVEVPVNMVFVEGYTTNGEQPVYTQAEAAAYFKAESDATELPFIFLSAGVTNGMFINELQFAKQAGCEFNGVLCGRATWKPSTDLFANEGETAGRKWLGTEGKANIKRLNDVLAATATQWTNKVTVTQYI
ncbi:tagatose 1,6-diphosphate aldolase [Lactiplantibacillus argentoratensis]|jgi:tagatose 1,6-diphosphate aldolase|uniref:tagatose 1,6-diphosphate aldolase n=1 Tax=Lactiplantibacillus argentoratensis TaxID=271881 RepID=UPI00073B93E5|nr:tagatose 1,6-diphosphate aldolase [Lactiplantibacillus argentoratensis]KTF00968.1 Tagatose 16-diphosphate aldolase [Lactiplantibacillus plantarum]KZT81916.1 Tagatose 1 6-bisphosphate aldolase [Lactiplantibacillus plantarum]MCT4442930.1 tagatose 1,6-diphosphate aldolase [Lactiplantibacillus argentoratensis]GEK63084.1 tagatose 1,6-diphosphate aldolase [Lactobacillus japonicus]